MPEEADRSWVSVGSNRLMPRFLQLVSSTDQQVLGQLWSLLWAEQSRRGCRGQGHQPHVTLKITLNSWTRLSTALFTLHSTSTCLVSFDHHIHLVRWVGTQSLCRWKRHKNRADVQSVQVASVWTDGACAVPVTKYFEYHPGWTTGPWLIPPPVAGMVFQAWMFS